MNRRAPCGVLLAALALALVPAGAAAATPPRPETLEVFAAASLTDAFTELARALEARRPGLKVRLNFAGSQQLAAQIEQGARADVYAPADERWMSRLRERRLLAGPARAFAWNRLVVVLPSANPGRIGRLQDLARPGVKLVIGADAVPVGRYGRLVLADLDRDPAFGAGFAARALRNVVSEEENVKSVLAKVRLGEADAGLVYRSDVTPALASAVRVLELPAAADVPVPYSIAVVKGARAPAAARAFVDLALSREGRAILARNGFAPPAEDGR